MSLDVCKKKLRHMAGALRKVLKNLAILKIFEILKSQILIFRYT